MNSTQIKTLFFTLFSLSLPAGIRCENPAADLKLFGAVVAGDMSIAQEALNEGADPDHINQPSRQTPLLAAVDNRDVAMVELLLQNNALPDVNIDILGYSPLVSAILAQDKDITEALLKYNADPNKGDSAFTPLIAALSLNDTQCMLLLFAHGARTDVMHKDITPLQSILYSDNDCLDTITLLLEEQLKGTDFTAPEYDVVEYLLFSAFLFPSKEGRAILKQDLQVLIQGIPPQPNQPSYAEIHTKIRANRQASLQTLLTEDITPEFVSTLSEAETVKYLHLTTEITGCTKAIVLLLTQKLHYAPYESAEDEFLNFLLLFTNPYLTAAEFCQLMDTDLEKLVASLSEDLRILYTNVYYALQRSKPTEEQNPLIAFLTHKKSKPSLMSFQEYDIVEHLLFLASANAEEQIQGLEQNTQFSFEEAAQTLPFSLKLFYERLQEEVLLVGQGPYGPQLPLNLEEQD
jgi:ankyrin repeat protein